jgi:uracil-DNA glycosylase
VKHVPPQLPRGGKCKLAFVAEAPSDDELIHGQPLVGPSGRVYNQLLAVAGIDRAEVLTTNLFDFQLPDNEVSNVTVSAAEAKAQGWEPWCPPLKRRHLSPDHEAQLKRLEQELATAEPTVVVPLGGTALWAFTGHSRISESRGAVGLGSGPVRWRGKIVPTFHPATVMRNWEMFTTVAGDFIKADHEAERGSRLRLAPRELWVAPDLGDLAEFQRRYIDCADLIAIDIETGWGQITCVGFGVDAEHAICVPFTDARRPGHSYWTTTEAEMEAWEWVRMTCENGTPKLLQNGPYDAYWLRTSAGIWVRNYRHDTRLAHQALFPELPKSLEFMGGTYANAPAWKLMRGERQEKRDD